MNEKLYSMDLEASVLSIFMINYGVDESIEAVEESDFHSAKHVFIFQQIKKLHSNGQGHDVTVINDICKKNSLCGVDEQYLTDICTQSTGSPHRIAEYIATLRDYASRRALFNAGERIKAIACDVMQYDSIEAVAQSESVLASLETSDESSTAISAFDVSINLFAKIDKRITDRKNGVFTINGVQTGFKDLDQKLGDIARGDLVIIGARPSMGKTVIIQDMMIDISARQKKAVVFQSAEMNSEKVGERLLSSISEIPLSRIKGALVEEDEWGKFTDATNLLKEVEILIDDKSMPTLNDIRKNCRKIKAKHGEVGAVFVDYLTMLTPPIKTDQNHLAVGAISKGLKGIAKEFNCPVICLSQLSRKVDDRADKRPMLSDLRESGQIEQDADIIMFLYRDEYYNKSSKEAGIVEVIIGKARDGEVGTVRLGSELQYSRFTDLTLPQYFDK
jgi:replicative DNA helicase